MLQAIKDARGQLVGVGDLRKEEAALQATVDAFCHDVCNECRAVGRSAPVPAHVSKVLADLVQGVAQAEEAQRRVDVLQESLDAHETRLKSLQRHVDQRQKEIDELLLAASATDEEAFRQIASNYESQQHLTQQVTQLELRLRQLVGSASAIEAVSEELSKTSPDELTAEQAGFVESIERLERAQTDAADQRGRLKEQLDRLENSDELSRLRIEQQADRAEFAALAEEWSILKVATLLIERAREKYERERRPGVLKDAERYFARFTRGNFTEIRAPAGGDQVLVLAPNGSAKEIGQLSRGTAEQLYLSLRFGFVQSFVGRSEPLPLVFDDILVNFDASRARATVEAILELSAALQILFFTCHRSTVDLMREMQSDIPVYQLKDGELSLMS